MLSVVDSAARARPPSVCAALIKHCIVKFDFGKMKLDLEHTHIGWGIVRGLQGGCKPFKIPLQGGYLQGVFLTRSS